MNKSIDQFVLKDLLTIIRVMAVDWMDNLYLNKDDQYLFLKKIYDILIEFI